MARLDLINNLAKRKLYTKWSNMIQRCTNPKDPKYPVYGNRGIKVSGGWMKFDNFYNDMSTSFKTGLTLDRIDTNGDYSKENCRWVTQETQQNNRTNNKVIEYKGLKDTLAGWSRRSGIKQSTLWMRLYRYNMSAGEALRKGGYRLWQID